MSGGYTAVQSGPVPQAPQRPSDTGRNLVAILSLAVVFALAARVIELRPLELVRDAGNIGVFLKGYLHPSFAHIGEYAWQCVVTICIALWGTLLAILIEALKFKKAEVGWLGPKAYVEATNNNYANIEPVAQVRAQSGSLGYRSCLIANSDSDIFMPEDIGGKSFAFNDPNSTSGYLLPMTFFLTEMGIDPKKHFAKVMFSGSHEASILAVANKKVDVASTNLPDMQQLTREGKVPRGALRVIWVSKLIPNDPVVIRKELPASLRSAIQESLVTMKDRNPEAFGQAGAFFGGGFVRVDDSKYQIIRDMNDAAKKLAAQK